MARRSGGATGFAVALVILSIFFVAALVVAILLATEREDLKNAARVADDELRKYVTATESKQPWVIQHYEKAGGSNPTVVRSQQDEIRQLRMLINGDDQASSEATKVRLKESLEEAGYKEGDTLVSLIKNLGANRGRDRSDNKQLQDELAAERETVIKVKADAATKAQGYEQAKTETQAKLTALQGEFDRFKAGVGQEYKKLEDQIATMRASSQEKINDLEGRSARLQAENDNLQIVINELRRPKQGPRMNAPAPEKQVDGEVVNVLPEEQLVYINRGSNQRVVLGLTFEVYDKKRGVTPDDFGQMRGKATVEVVRVNPENSLAHIVRSNRNNEITNGDVIANAVYDPDKAYKFYIAGDFDIDGIGKPQVDDVRRIASMIAQWGGKSEIRSKPIEEEEATRRDREEWSNLLTAAQEALTDGTVADTLDLLEAGLTRLKKRQQDPLRVTLGYDTDFLVLGIEPELPPKPDDTADPLDLQNWRLLALQYEMLKALEQEAKDLGIPVLNQNRFLALVGYYRR